MSLLSATIVKELESTINKMAAPGKGLLAADESTATITKRFDALDITSTEEMRRDYRELLLTTPSIAKFISGVILYEETLNQKTSQGVTFVECLNQQGIVPGIKVDKGLVHLANTVEENVTQGLDGLAERLVEYKNKGARFAKWRAVYAISNSMPSKLAIKTNAEVLARYAAICQEAGIVPIVEPEVLIDGDHTLEMCAEVSEKVLHVVFNALYKNKVALEYAVLKPSMIIPGKKSSQKASAEQVAKATLTILKRTVPAALPTINFLSGGQTPEQATANLNAMHLMAGSLPWNLSFSYARALQEPCMNTWLGKAANKKEAQQAFYHRAELNSLASSGKYKVNMEKELAVN
jgi:fructose-bisphosphate aldolase class I